MAQEVWLKRQGDSLVPIDAGQAAIMAELPFGQVFKASITKAQSRPMHRLFMGMCALVARGLNSGPAGDWDTDSVKEMFKLVTGHYRVIPMPRALRTAHPRAIGLLPKSIKFHKMPHKERLDMTNAALAFLGQEMAPWLVDTPEWPEIAKITGQMEAEQ